MISTENKTRENNWFWKLIFQGKIIALNGLFYLIGDIVILNTVERLCHGENLSMKINGLY